MFLRISLVLWILITDDQSYSSITAIIMKLPTDLADRIQYQKNKKKKNNNKTILLPFGKFCDIFDVAKLRKGL